MENVHLVPDDDDEDLYSGFNTFNPALATDALEHDEGFQQAVRTSHGRRPPPPPVHIHDHVVVLNVLEKPHSTIPN